MVSLSPVYKGPSADWEGLERPSSSCIGWAAYPCGLPALTSCGHRSRDGLDGASTGVANY